MSGRPAYRQGGQVVIIVAAVLPVLFAMLAILVDIGVSYSTRERVRAAADAAALAAVRALGQSGTDAQILTAATSYAGLNGASLDTITNPPFYVNQSGTALATVGGGTVPTGAAGVEVRALVSLSSFFGGLLGRPVLPIGVSSRAMVTAADTWPVGVPNQTYTVGVTYKIEGAWVNWQTAWGSDSGDVGLLDYRDGSSATDIKNDLNYGYPSAVTVGSTLPQANPSASAMKAAMQLRLANGRTTVVTSVVTVSSQKKGSAFKKVIRGFAIFSLDTPNNRSVTFDGTAVDGVYMGSVATNTGYQLKAPSTL